MQHPLTGGSGNDESCASAMADTVPAAEAIAARPWQGPGPPARILAIRLQAMGDTVLTLPYLHALRLRLPDARLDFLTRSEVADIPKNVVLFDRVFELGGGRGVRRQLVSACMLLPLLLARRYQVVLDLQRNQVSRMVRTLLHAPAWSEFDRYSPMLAGERTRRTIEGAGLGPLDDVLAGLELSKPEAGAEKLEAAGWVRGSDLVLLNPAGAFADRHWPVERYAAFAEQFAARRSRPTQFVMTGLPRIASQVAVLKARLGDRLLDLVQVPTSLSEAAAIIQRCILAVSEDGGLMHVAWVLGVPTVGLFGAARWVWARPHGNHSELVLACSLPDGVCMHGTCRRGSSESCLADIAPSTVVDAALRLLDRTGQQPRVIRSATQTRGL